MNQGTFALTAHSGCDGTKDNSLEFIIYGLSQNVEALEVDIRQKNGELYLAHDALEDISVAPKLADAFEKIKERPDIAMNCDLKEEGLEEMVLVLLEECQCKNPIVFSGTVALDKVRYLEESKYNQVEVYLNVEFILEKLYQHENGAFRFEDDPSTLKITQEQRKEIVKEMKHYGASVLNINFLFADEALAKELKEEGISLSLWTPSTEEYLDKAMKLCPKNITTRAVNLALGLRKSEEEV